MELNDVMEIIKFQSSSNLFVALVQFTESEEYGILVAKNGRPQIFQESNFYSHSASFSFDFVPAKDNILYTVIKIKNPSSYDDIINILEHFYDK